jgi:gas vesicle protein
MKEGNDRGYDRLENAGNGGSSFVMGLLTGTVLGAGLGMLFAPKAGSQLRTQISEQAGSLVNTASDGYKRASEAAGDGYKRVADAAGDGYKRAADAAGEWVGKGREFYGKAREAVSRGAEEAERYGRDNVTGVSSGLPTIESAGSTGSSGSFGSSGSSASYGGGSRTDGSDSGSRGSHSS